ncbi:MAG: DUF2797 domain-containing protein [Flavobacteriaceae bacterium]|nr:DUF2797 domain-containing protein [Flavobacteriaceae bacterium]
MNYQGVLKKMLTEFESPIQYYLEMDTDFINVNQLLNKNIEITFEKYQCLCCGLNKKIFRQGHCYNCFYKSAQVGDWIMKPELSTAHLGIEDRDLTYEKQAQLQPHIVYLALSSAVKVGVTRKLQVPTRWIDQGASKAIIMLEVPNRYLAGITEVALKEFVSDKTSWQKMLKNAILDIDLTAEVKKLAMHIPPEVKSYFLENNENVLTMNFPVLQYPTKIKSINLEKTPNFEGKLKGIKGQYLIFEDGRVFNVRNNEGNVVSLSVT